ncbi:MFS transporter [Thermoleophilia bacterium SCSIO 60948]|nr:MFS transporter [Thermoleophilia bacterium SCSIO 60948]
MPAGGSAARTSPLGSRSYRHLFAAQVASLVGTGVTTVALGLLAFELSGANAGAVLGIALALKMVAYVGLAPVIAAFAHKLPRRALLVGLDLARIPIVIAMVFVTEAWQVFVLIFLLNACAAGFTPAYQATLPDVLPDERRYTQALSFSRVAYDLQELLSPLLAAALLLLIDFHGLFALDALTFAISAGLVITAQLPDTGRHPISERSASRITEGVRIYLATPRLRGLLALNLAVAAASATTVVNTVVLVRDRFEAGESAVGLALALAGLGSVAVALALPRLLERIRDRSVMLMGGALLAPALALIPILPSYVSLLAVWALLGVGLSLVQTPAGRLIQRSGKLAERPSLFAAQFSLSHACWLFTYPIAGVAGVALGVGTVSLILAGIALIAVITAAAVWPGQREAGRSIAVPTR